MTSYDILMLVLNDAAHDSRVRREASALAAAGWRVLVIGTQRHNGLLPDEETISGFTLRRVRYGRFGAGLWRPWRWFRHGLQAIQLLLALITLPTRAYHAHDLPALMLLFAARGPRRRPLIYDSHELFLFQSPHESQWVNRWQAVVRMWLRPIERFLIRHADAVIAASEPYARLLARWYGVPRPVVVANMIDPAKGRDSASGGRWIVHTGDVTNRARALTELVEAVALLPPDVRLVFLGQGDAVETLRRRAAELKIAERVCFMPPVAPEQVAHTIQGASAAMLLKRPDSWNSRGSWPIKLFEAVAAGLPVVAATTFGVRWLVERYQLGELCDPADPRSIAAAIERILEPDAQARYREQVRAAQQWLNWRGEAAKLVAVYQDVLA